MEEIIKAYSEAESQFGEKIKELEIWVGYNIYRSLEYKKYNGLNIYTSVLMPSNLVYIGKLFI